MDYEQVVVLYHEHLYRFAFSLTGNGDDAGDLTQEAYYRLLAAGRQLRDPAKVKSWLFTTLYRVFLGQKRHARRFPHLAIDAVEHELPALTPELINAMDSALAVDTLLELDELHRTPLVLFYLQNLSYHEIAEILEIPVGTVMSRLARGKDALRERLALRAAGVSSSKVIPVNPPSRIRPE
jgi:RNA polymerase sigma-70 factor (ECF subfamily)